MENKESLLTFFTISVAAFDFAATVCKVMGKERQGAEIEAVHRALLSELSKPDPDMIWVKIELINLQGLVDDNAKKEALPKNFPSGGVFSES